MKIMRVQLLLPAPSCACVCDMFPTDMINRDPVFGLGFDLFVHLRVPCPCLGALALEAQVGNDGRVGAEVGRDEERDVAHVLHLGQLCRIVHLNHRIKGKNAQMWMGQRAEWHRVRTAVRGVDLDSVAHSHKEDKNIWLTYPRVIGTPWR